MSENEVVPASLGVATVDFWFLVLRSLFLVRGLLF
jgi:hypothetical protein